MKQVFLTLVFALLSNCIVKAQYNYPATRKVVQTDTVFKHTLHDPYRWLENLKSEEVKNWFVAQQAFTDSILQHLSGIDNLIEQLNDYNTQNTWWRSPVVKFGNKYIFTKGGRNQLNILYYYKTGNDTTEHFVFDTWQIHPNKRYTLGAFAPSSNNQYLLVGFDEKGQEYPFLKIYDFVADKWLQDSIPNAYNNTISWDAASKGFIYGVSNSNDRFAPENINKDVFKYHQLGTAYNYDKIVMDSSLSENIEHKTSDNLYTSLFTANSKKRIYVKPSVGFESESTGVYYKNATGFNDTQKWKKMFTGKDSVYAYFDLTFFLETTSGYYFISAKGNGLKSLRKASFTNPDFSNAKIILPENELWQLEYITSTKSYILACYSKYGFLDKVVFIDKKTDKVIPVNSISAYKRFNVATLGDETDECVFNVTDINRPRRSFILDISKDKLVTDNYWSVQNQTLLDGYDNIVSEIIEVPSYDGTLVPLNILRDKSTRLDGNNVCILYGYGAYGIGAKNNKYNSYDPSNNLVLQRGVILAHAYVRGGGEKGEAWHNAGMKLTKPNSWKDFIACAEYLIKNNYTQPSKLACSGGSAGGTLIGRTITERPDLFAAALLNVGLLNTTRIGAYTNGVANFGEYGNPANENEFNGLVEMDAVLKTKPNTNYPAMYITAGMNDSRVIAWMPAKFAATMQANSASARPILLHTNFEGGHYGNDNAKTLIDKTRTQLMGEFFLLWQCGHKDFRIK